MGVVDRIWIVFAALNGAVAVAAGAYASHGLAGDPQAQELFRIAGQYQMWHALALLGAALFASRTGGASRLLLRAGGWLFVAGILLFPGTLYTTGSGMTLPVGSTAPLGGTAFMAGWLALALMAVLPVRAERTTP
jgi:uncharacterized membrane protein YgdD (TMEM256/DUF423 family)